MSAAAACSAAKQAVCSTRRAGTRPAAPASPAAPLAAAPRPAARLPARRRARLAVAAAAASSSTATDVSAHIEVLRRACRTKKVPSEEVMAAMEALEAAHKQQSLVQGFPAALTGTWRLVYSAPSPIKAWHYIPVLEDAIIDADQGTVDLASVVGPLDNVFKGRGTFRQDPATASFAMDFGFTGAEAKWFGRWTTQSEFSEKRKTYSFFLLTDDLAAAQSSGGPKTLMYRVK